MGVDNILHFDKALDVNINGTCDIYLMQSVKVLHRN